MDIYKYVNGPTLYLLVYLLLVNIYGFLIMGIDKWKALHKRYRIPEKVLFIAAFAGGALGVYMGMKVFHHKTLHSKFKFGVPALLIVNILAISYLLYRF